MKKATRFESSGVLKVSPLLRFPHIRFISFSDSCIILFSVDIYGKLESFLSDKIRISFTHSYLSYYGEWLGGTHPTTCTPTTPESELLIRKLAVLTDSLPVKASLGGLSFYFVNSLLAVTIPIESCNPQEAETSVFVP